MEQNSILDIINILKTNFDIHSVQDYQKLLLIIYNEMFIHEDLLTSEKKYALYNIINSVINDIEADKYKFTTDDLYYLLMSPLMSELF